jgi:hypothetical protein
LGSGSISRFHVVIVSQYWLSVKQIVGCPVRKLAISLLTAEPRQKAVLQLSGVAVQVPPNTEDIMGKLEIVGGEQVFQSQRASIAVDRDNVHERGALKLRALLRLNRARIAHLAGSALRDEAS